MIAILELATGILLTGVAAAIAGLAIELILSALGRSLAARPNPVMVETRRANIINFKGSENSDLAVGLAKRAA